MVLALQLRFELSHILMNRWMFHLGMLLLLETFYTVGPFSGGNVNHNSLLLAGGNVNNNNFPSSNAKKFRPSFEGENDPSQDGLYSPATHTELSGHHHHDHQQPSSPHQKPKREKSPPEKDTRSAFERIVTMVS